jgi:hypothetical protein
MILALAALGLLATGWWYLEITSGVTATPDTGLSGNGTQAPFPAGDSDNVLAPGWTMGAHVPITSDTSTWPSGDRYWNIARAIAMAEGANVRGSAPDRNNNPGDISDGADYYGFDPLVRDSKVTRFPDKDTGWKWLYQKIVNAATGQSSVYSPDMTWNEIAQKWAGNWQHWVANVTRNLGVDANSTLRQYVGG